MWDAELPRAEVIMEGVRVHGYDHLVDSWSVGVIVFSMCVTVLPWPDGVIDISGTTSIRLTYTEPFIEDENEPEIIRRITGRRISWHTLHEVDVSATGTWTIFWGSSPSKV